MIDWAQFTLFLFIAMRMSGFVLFNPIFGRTTLPGLFRAGMTLVLSVAVYYTCGQSVQVPATILELSVRLLLEMLLGYAFGYVIHLFFTIPLLAGEVIDTQMGMTMAKTYDASTQFSVSVTSTLLNVLMVLLFFAANGHITLLRIVLTSGDVVPFGAVTVGKALTENIVLLFSQCMLMAVKLALPVLGAELMGQVGMGILMKAIPQINIFGINLELKIIIGLAMLYILIAPFSEFLLNAETTMLGALQGVLSAVG